MLEIKAPVGKIEGRVELPVSKSIMNRYLILKKLSGKSLPAKESIYPNDVNVMIDVLSGKESDVNVSDAGTVMRFCTAYYSAIPGEKILRGSGRMHERPIHILVDALRQWGADITYLEKEGYPPLQIRGRKLKGGHAKVAADVSSQFISALLMIAPYCEEKTAIELSGKILSEPYINLTIDLMLKMAVEVMQDVNVFEVYPARYADADIVIEKDWSSAAFVLEMVALSEEASVSVNGLRMNSAQGDKKCVDLFKMFGVEVEAQDWKMSCKKKKDFKVEGPLAYDFMDTPDLVQPALMTALGLGIEMKLTGLYNLHLKESDRLFALKAAVENAGGELMVDDNTAHFIPGELKANGIFQTFEDHRMAMSVAPLALKLGAIQIDEGRVVSKSFPHFWTELKHLNFDIV